jgi:hypothetical protein
MNILAVIAIISTVISVIISSLTAVIVARINHKYSEEVELGNLRNKWLKAHYDEIVKEMDSPFIMDNTDYGTLNIFISAIGTLTGSRWNKVIVEYGYELNFIKDKHLYSHLQAAEYRESFKKLEEVTESIHR